MCDRCDIDGASSAPEPPGRPAAALTRRSVLAAPIGILAAVASSESRTTRRGVAQPEILPRSSWAEGRTARRPLEVEQPLFLLVHHTAQPNSDYSRDDVPRLLQGIFDAHTGSDKGWPDVAYNFFVDRFGRVYEGRTGSIVGPVRGSATGGNQGYSQLCCFLGDFQSLPPDAEALDSMCRLLAWLADRDGIDVAPGSTVQFASLGSNRWPAGSTVRTRTISGHRDVSLTACPGDAAYQLLEREIPMRVQGLLGAMATPSTTTTAVDTTTTTIGPTTTATPATSVPSASTNEGSPPDEASTRKMRSRTAPERVDQPGDDSSGIGLLVGIGSGAAVALGLSSLWLRSRRDRAVGRSGDAPDQSSFAPAAPPVETGGLGVDHEAPTRIVGEAASSQSQSGLPADANRVEVTVNRIHASARRPRLTLGRVLWAATDAWPAERIAKLELSLAALSGQSTVLAHNEPSAREIGEELAKLGPPIPGRRPGAVVVMCRSDGTYAVAMGCSTVQAVTADGGTRRLEGSVGRVPDGTTLVRVVLDPAVGTDGIEIVVIDGEPLSLPRDHDPVPDQRPET